MQKLQTTLKNKRDLLPGISAALACAALVLVQLVCIGFVSLRVDIFFVFWVLLPGLAVADFLLPDFKQHKFLSAFCCGCILLFLAYYLGLPLGTSLPVRVLPPAVGLVWAFFRLQAVHKTGARPKARAGYWHVVVLAVVGIATAYSMWLTLYAMPSPAEVVNPDYYWHMGNVWTLSTSPGLEDLRVAGMPFKYHYFSDLLWACGQLVTGVEPYQWILRTPACVVPAVMVAGVYGLMQQGGGRKAALAATCVALFATPLFGRFNDVGYQWATNVNAVGLALPSAIWLVLVSRHLLEAERIGVKGVLAALLGAALVTGMKGPFGVCVLSCVVGGSILLLRWRRRGFRFPKGWLPYLLALCAGFILVWRLLLSTGLNEDYIKSWQLFYSVFTAEVLAAPLIALGEGVFARGVLLLPHLFLMLGVFCVPFLCACVRLLVGFVKGRGPDGTGILLAAATLPPLAIFYLLDLQGRSQFYFLYFVVPFAGCLALREVAGHWWPWLKRRRLPALALGCAALLVAGFAALHPYREAGAVSYLGAEVQAAEWLRDNVQGNELVAVNSHGTMYIASGLSGRQFYLEGSGYAKNSGYTQEMLAGQAWENDNLFRDGYGDKAALARELGVTWLLQYTRIADEDLQGVPEGFVLCWESEGVYIWRLDEDA